MLNRLAAFLYISICSSACIGAPSLSISSIDYSKAEEDITKSSGYKDLATFLRGNGFKISAVSYVQFDRASQLSSIDIEGVKYNLITKDLVNFIKSNVAGELYYDLLNKHGLGISERTEDANFLVQECLDLHDVSINDGLTKLSIDIYFAVVPHTKKSISIAIETKPNGCMLLHELEYIYKKKISKQASIYSCAVAGIKNDYSTELREIDRIYVLFADAITQAFGDFISNPELLIALKDSKYFTGTNRPSINGSNQEASSSNDPLINLKKAKNTCLNLGFRKGSKDFADCVLQMTNQ